MGNIHGMQPKKKSQNKNKPKNKLAKDKPPECLIGRFISIIKPKTTVLEFYNALTRNETTTLCDINHWTCHGWTLLQLACQEQNLPIAKALIYAGANVNAVLPSEGTTPLNFALGHHNFELFKMIVEHGGVAFYGLSSYLQSYTEGILSNSNHSKEVIENIYKIIDYILKHNIKDFKHHYINVTHSFNDSFENNDVEKVKAILEHTKINPNGYNAETTIRKAVTRGWFPMVQVLVKHGALIIEDDQGLSNAELARRHNHEDIAQFLEETQRLRYQRIKFEANIPKRHYLFHFGIFSDPNSNLAMLSQCRDIALEIEKTAWKIATI